MNSYQVVIVIIYRSIIARKLRDSPLQVSCIVCGWDDVTDSPCIFWLDNIGSLQKVPYAVHGRDSMLILSILDQYIGGRGSKYGGDDELIIPIESSEAKNNKDNHDSNQDEISKVQKLIMDCMKNVYKRSTSKINKFQIKSLTRGKKMINHGFFRM